MPATNPTAGERMKAALAILFTGIADRLERKVCRPDGPRVIPDELYDFEAGDAAVVEVNGILYELDVSATVRELNKLEDAELFPPDAPGATEVES